MLGRVSSGARGAAVANALRLLEARFGDVESLRHVGDEITTREDGELRREDVERLLAHDTLAVHVKGFYPEKQALEVADMMLADEDVRNWSVASGGREAEPSDVDAVGTPHNVAVANDELEAYFGNSVEAMRKWRYHREDGVLAMGPMDKFRLELDEIWTEGCLLSREKGGDRQPFQAGVPRIMRPASRYDPARWTRGFAHVDELAIMSPDRGLFSANIYLRNAPSGGELQIWPVTFASRWDFYRNAPTLSLALLQDAQAQAALRERLPDPVTVKVRPGDLVLICTQRPHGVRGPVVGGPRVSIQGFLQYERGQPLRLEA
ncbi:Hypothetical Protein FCC1311_083012 [Hondaea fermentalgiana]|uniref:Fe2OG dioxygenase domain-containing protein n=1 Tax=Hondaea fermentalgiana TaxID=2315210 RepID=A0A2R5GMH1_9STRA|nr:Hypothetical Protein FCC1311_083012 [Hondaea fermentalgiana]|eukprot:GBG32076.1 Hypothetical Protein FCC1311_083012 [Hondaea fermentalgiana]